MNDSRVAASQGTVDYIVAYDIGYEVDMNVARELLVRQGLRVVSSSSIGLRQPAFYFEFAYGKQLGDGLAVIGGVITVYHYGTISVRYRTERGEFGQDKLGALGAQLSKHVLSLQGDARERASRVFAAILPSIRNPALTEALEDYVVVTLSIANFDTGKFLENHGADVCKLLAMSSDDPAEQRVKALSDEAIHWRKGDLTIVGWNVALLVNISDERPLHIVEYLNAQLSATQVMRDIVTRAFNRCDELRKRWFSWIRGTMIVEDLEGECQFLFDDLRTTLPMIRDEYLYLIHQRAVAALKLEDAEQSIRQTLESMQTSSESLFNRGLNIWVLLLTVVATLPVVWDYGAGISVSVIRLAVPAVIICVAVLLFWLSRSGRSRRPSAAPKKRT